jgi:iron complex transport system ATP-binding protein
MSISANEVDFSFGDSDILKEISFRAAEGKLIGVIGPNGSGKTTLLKTLSRVLKPKKGIVYLKGEEISGLSHRQIAKKMAVVPQDTTVNFDFTAYEIVLMGRTPHIGRLDRESPGDRRVARDIMELTNTSELGDRLITTLSGGERQKVIIAKALTQEPRVLLLDEPTANLDICNQIEIMELIRDAVVSKQITAIMAIHDINLAARYCNEMILLKDGKIFAKGLPKDILTRENIKEVFDVLSVVNGNPADGSVYVVPLSPREKFQTDKVT